MPAKLRQQLAAAGPQTQGVNLAIQVAKLQSCRTNYARSFSFQGNRGRSLSAACNRPMTGLPWRQRFHSRPWLWQATQEIDANVTVPTREDVLQELHWRLVKSIDTEPGVFS